MREIKFRGLLGGQFVYGYYFKNHKTNEEGIYDINTNIVHYLDGRTIGQFTGLKDKNGKEIYEWDIVKTNWDCGNNIRIIGTNPFSKQLMQMDLKRYLNNKEGESNIWLANDSKYADGGDAEIIGNIYENDKILLKNT